VSVGEISFQVDLGSVDSYSREVVQRYTGFWDALEKGMWEPETFNALDRFLTKDLTFVDLGAWVGPVSLFAASKGNTVHAYDVDPVAFERLKLNIDCNPALAHLIHAVKLGVSDSSGAIDLFSEFLGSSQTSVTKIHRRGGAHKSIPYAMSAQAITLDDILESLPQHCVFLKCDVEGAEYSIFRQCHGARLDKVKGVLISTHPENIERKDGFKNGRSSLLYHSASLIPLLSTFNQYFEHSDNTWKAINFDQIIGRISQKHVLPNPMVMLK